MRFVLPFAVSATVIFNCAFAAETTPLTAPLSEEKEITVTCELSKTEPEQNVVVFTSAKDGEKVKGTYHYKLWLPKGYLADPQRRWPVMFIASPSGNAVMGAMASRLKSSSYVVVMLVESKNGPWEPIVGNFLAAHDDVVQRVRIQEGLKFATGMSGGARASSVFVQARPGFAGVILQGAGMAAGKDGNYNVDNLRKMPGFLVAMTMGEKDSNKSEVARVKSTLPGSAKFLPLSFPGGHLWAPADVFDKALTWMERHIYVEGPVRPELKPIYVSYFNQQHVNYAALTIPWERYQAGSALLDFARARNLSMDASVAPRLREIQAETSKLRADPAIAREAMAADALRRLQESFRGASPDKVAADLTGFAKRYPGTEAAKKAEEQVATAK